MICVPLSSKRVQNLVENINPAQKISDVVELWLEEAKDLSQNAIKQIFALKRRPYIIKFQGNIELFPLLNGFIFEYIDIDLFTPPKVLREIRTLFPSTQIIVSHHDFEKTPAENKLRALLSKMEKMKADIKKIATKACSLSDSLLLLSLVKEYSDRGEKVILIGMGKEGIITRTAGHLCGNYLSYCPLSNKQKTAPGQLTAKEFKKIMDLTR